MTEEQPILHGQALTFGEALNFLKQGHIVSRSRPEIGMEAFGIIGLQPGYGLEEGVTANKNTQQTFGTPPGVRIAHAPYLQRCVCLPADESGSFPRMLSFYAPTTKDLLANDWYIVAK